MRLNCIWLLNILPDLDMMFQLTGRYSLNPGSALENRSHLYSQSKIGRMSSGILQVIKLIATSPESGYGVCSPAFFLLQRWSSSIPTADYAPIVGTVGPWLVHETSPAPQGGAGEVCLYLLCCILQEIPLYVFPLVWLLHLPEQVQVVGHNHEAVHFHALVLYQEPQTIENYVLILVWL